MSEMKCPKHGPASEAFVCQHIVAGMRQGQAVGFFWAAGSTSAYPDAWCRACNTRLEKSGGEWTGEAAAQLGVKLICHHCYLEARALALGGGNHEPL